MIGLLSVTVFVVELKLMTVVFGDNPFPERIAPLNKELELTTLISVSPVTKLLSKVSSDVKKASPSPSSSFLRVLSSGLIDDPLILKGILDVSALPPFSLNSPAVASR